jgi:hypothetical protein
MGDIAAQPLALVELSMDMSRQTFTLGFQLLNQDRGVYLYKLVERSVLWAMAFIGGVTKGVLAWRTYVASTPARANLKSNTVER